MPAFSNDEVEGVGMTSDEQDAAWLRFDGSRPLIRGTQDSKVATRLLSRLNANDPRVGA